MRVKIEKKYYHQFCKSENTLPVFFQDWYLNAVCQDGKWDVIVLLENGKPIAALPYFYKRKAIFKYLTMPHLCFQTGPHIIEGQRHRQEEIMPKLLDSFPKFDFIEQRWHYLIEGLPSNISNQFQVQKRYSYRIEDLSDLTKVYEKLHPDYRNNKIKKAKQLVSIKEDLDIETFYRINKMTFDRQGVAIPYSLSFLRNLDTACAKHQSRKIFYAIDDQQQIHSVLYLVWDQLSSYMLMAGDDPGLRKSGAGIWLTWEAIRYTKEQLGLNIFDFEGSMIPSIERVRKNFGASRKYYLQVNQEQSWLFKMINKIKNK